MATLLVGKELSVTLDALCRPFQDHAVSQLEVKIAGPFRLNECLEVMALRALSAVHRGDLDL